jgi:hypothetical protein
MPRQPKWMEILPVLEAFLDRVVRGEADLPTTEDGCVNLVRLMLRLGLKENDRQYFYKYAELSAPLEAVAASVGLGGSRGRPESEDDALDQRLARHGAKNKALEEENVELRARLRRVTRERDGLLERLRLVQETGRVLRSRVPARD